MRFLAVLMMALCGFVKPLQAADQPVPVIFTVPDLPYGYDALAPVIDKETMQLHHDKHHVAYVDKLNAAVKDTPALQGKTLEQIFADITKYEPVVRNNAGGHYNHSLYWRLMAPVGKGGKASPELLAQITKDFGSLEKFEATFVEAGTKQFGSGWVWLIWTGDKLVVASTPNQDNPLMADAKVKGTPILANDLWEHAYYLTYRNKRDEYLKNWWKVVNWTTANGLFAGTSAKKQ
jgi:Fe-Mn family superoxide dismutase